MRQTSFALVLGVVFASSAHAESLPEFVGETIVVTPSRFPEALSGQTASTTVITRQEIENSPQSTLPELLSQYAGIGTRDLLGNHATVATVDLRGFGAAARQNTLILLDGHRLNDVDLSVIDWSAIPLSAIERIEIVRGGSSVLHGGGAVGGVVNIITHSPLEQHNQTTGRVELGSFNAREVQVSGNLSGDTAAVRLDANHYRTDGWRDNSETTLRSLNGDAHWKHALGELTFRFGGDDQDVRLPGPRVVEPDAGLNEATDNPKGTSTPLDWVRRKGQQAGLDGSFNFGRNTVLLDLDYRTRQQQSYNAFGGYPSYLDVDIDQWSFSPRIRLSFETGNMANSMVVGADFLRWESRVLISNAEANIGTPINRVTAEQDTSALYARDEIELDPATRLTLGSRYERVVLDARDEFNSAAPSSLPGSGAAPGGQDVTQSAWELGLNHRLDPDHALFARVARSFRFATVDEIYNYVPSPSHEFQFLKPQTSHDAQLGWEWGRGPNRLRSAAYYMRVKDEIHLDTHHIGIGNTNFPPLERYGLELDANGRLNSLDWHAAYTLAFAKFTEGALNGVSLDGKDVPLVPRNKLSLGVVWHLDGQTRLAVDAQAVGRQRMDNDEPNSFAQKIPAYTLVDLKLVRQIGDWKLAVALNNLFDESYYTYAVHSTSNADRFYAYPLPGRNGWMSVEYTFK